VQDRVGTVRGLRHAAIALPSVQNRVSPSGYLVGLVVVIGLGTLLTMARSLYEVASGRFDWKGGKPMGRTLITVFAGTLETIWAAVTGAIQAPKG
jgi:hypothetical protein